MIREGDDPVWLEVVMPIGADPRHPEKQEAIRRGAARAGHRARFPLDDVRRGPFSLTTYVARLQHARAVLVDLSGESPSCYYELGIAEALELRVFLVAASGTPIHQTSTGDVIFYSDLETLEAIVADLLATETSRRQEALLAHPAP